MKILVVIDEYGWAFEFFARGWKKYSRHRVNFLKWADVTKERIADSDVVFTMSAVCYGAVAGRIPLSPEKTVCGIRSLFAHEQAPNPKILLASVANSERAFQIAKERNPEAINLYYLRGAIDGKEWTYADVSANKKVGWAGNPHQPVKRVRLFGQIAQKYGGVSAKADWGAKFFVPDRKRDDQLVWYRGIGCYLQVSNSEGLSQSLMEAFACGVPVVATPAGDTAKIVSPEWILPMDDAGCVQEANKKIEQIFSNQELARQIGIANRKKFESEGWCWSVRADEYDSLMEKLTGKL